MGDAVDPISYSAFICHAKADAERAEEIAATLEERGLTCWIAPRDARVGHDYAQEILRGIERSRCLVLVLSDAANTSTFVKREVERAVTKRKPVFPVRVEDVMPSPGLELFVASTHWIDAFAGRLVDHIDRLAQDLADEKALAEGTDLSARIARRRKLPQWIGMGAAAVGVIAAIVVGTIVSRRFEPPAPIANDTPIPAAAPTSPPGVYDPFKTSAKTLGIDPAAVKASDFRASIHPDRNLPGGHVLRITANEKIQKLLDLTEKKYTLPGASQPTSFFTWSTQVPPKPPPPTSGDVTIEFVSFATGTAPRHTVGPFRVPLHEGPPVSGTGSMVASLGGPARAEVQHRLADGMRENVERMRASARRAAPKMPPDPAATLDGLKAAFKPTEAEAVLAKRIALAPELEKELGITGDMPLDTSIFAGVFDARTSLFMNDKVRASRWRKANALSSHGLSNYLLGDTPALLCVPRGLGAEKNLRPWASLREVRVGTSRTAMAAVPVEATLLDVHRGRVPYWNHAMYVWLAELPADAEQVFVQYVYVDGEMSKVIEVPIESVIFK